MSQLEKCLEHYTALTEPRYGVFVTGEWGTGKSHQIKKCIPEDKLLYVSLYGVQTVEQLHSEVFAAYAPTTDQFGNMLKQISGAAAGIGGPFSLAGVVPSAFNAVFRRGMDIGDKILVFDDLERSTIKSKDVMGAINQYVEHRGFKVVVVAHDEKLTKKVLKMKEKTFIHTIRIKPQVDEALTEFILEIDEGAGREITTTLKAEISEVFNNSGVKSLRFLRYAITELGRLHRTLRQDHLENLETMRYLTRLFVAFQIEFLSDNLSESDLRDRPAKKRQFSRQKAREPESPLETPALIKCDAKYPTVNLASGLLNDNVLCAMLIDRQFPEDEIRMSVDESAEFAPDKYPWKVLYTLDNYDYDDNVVERAIRNMDIEFLKRNITDPGELLHIFSLRMQLAIKTIIEKDVDTIITENNIYIDDVSMNDRLQPGDRHYNWPTPGTVLLSKNINNGVIIQLPSKFKEDFVSTAEKLKKAQDKAFKLTWPGIQKEFVKKFQDNSDLFLKNLSMINHDNPIDDIPLLHLICSIEFVETWLRSPRHGWDPITYALTHRFQTNLDKGRFPDEQKWAQDVVKELIVRSNRSGLGAYRIREFLPNYQFIFDRAPQITESCGKACKDDPLGGKSASSLTHLVWLQKLLFVVQRWKGKRG